MEGSEPVPFLNGLTDSQDAIAQAGGFDLRLSVTNPLGRALFLPSQTDL